MQNTLPCSISQSTIYLHICMISTYLSIYSVRTNNGCLWVWKYGCILFSFLCMDTLPDFLKWICIAFVIKKKRQEKLKENEKSPGQCRSHRQWGKDSHQVLTDLALRVGSTQFPPLSSQGLDTLYAICSFTFWSMHYNMEEIFHEWLQS